MNQRMCWSTNLYFLERLLVCLRALFQPVACVHRATTSGATIRIHHDRDEHVTHLSCRLGACRFLRWVDFVPMLWIRAVARIMNGSTATLPPFTTE